MKTSSLVSAGFALTLSACANRPALPPETTGDTFIIERDLLGTQTATGTFKTITGVNREFTATLQGSWDGTTFTLLEDFKFADGEKDRKTWQLTRTAPGQYTGTREDVVGLAKGYQDGRAFRLEYDMRLPSENGKGRKVQFKDVMVFTEQGNVLNKATVGWLGFRVGSVSLEIKQNPEN